MAGKLKTFNVQKRFEIWVEQPVKARSMEEAVSMANDMNEKDFVTYKKGVEVCDVTHLPGTGVIEDWI